MDAGGVLLATLPMGPIQLPSLGLSLLKGALERAGVPCGVRYWNLEFLELICAELSAEERGRLYVRATERYQLAFACEAAFSNLLFGPDAERDAIIGQHLSGATDEEREFVAGVARGIPGLLRMCLDSVDWGSIRVLGLSSVFIGMTVPSALLAAAVKQRHPHVITVLGGPNTEGEMGETLLKHLPSIDFVLRGEADTTFPQLVKDLLAGLDPGPLPGLVKRGAGGAIQAWKAETVTDMDALPIPNFDDFLVTVERGGLAERYRKNLRLPFESSRGCWWGEVSHCKFCGINGDGMRFRAKSSARVIGEIDQLVERYHPAVLFAADAILSRTYFADLMPTLAEKSWKVGLSYEAKANIKRPQMAALSAAGVIEILPGIETFSTRILKLIGKGTSALDNLLCLRLAEEYGVRASWYHMCSLPFETVADYDDELKLLRCIHHLQPPREVARFTLQRFTPYYTNARAEGIARVRPLREYRAVFPFEPEVLQGLAYHFEFEFEDGRHPDDTARLEVALGRAILEWKERHERARLDLHSFPSGMLLLDSREEAAVVYVLGPAAAAIYEGIDSPQTIHTLLQSAALRRAQEEGFLDGLLGERDAEGLMARARELAGERGAQLIRVQTPFALGISESGDEARRLLGTFLDALCERGLAHCEGKRYLGLAVPRTRPSSYGSAAQARPASTLQVLQ